MHFLQPLPLLLPHLFLLILTLLILTMLCGAVIKQLRVGLHEQLQDVECEPMYRTVPMFLGVLVECPKDDGKEFTTVLVDQFHNVVIVPEEEGTLSHLKVGKADAKCQPPEKDNLHAVELR